MVVLLGKTASGKDTVVNKLIKEYNFKKIITYTTRPQRSNEKQNVTYHFISDEDFKQKIEERFFVEWKLYHAAEGDWYYGTAIEDVEDVDDKSIIILTPQGFRDISEKLKHKPKSIYLYANNKTIQSRLMKRGDNKEEAARRMRSDDFDFRGVENEVDRIVYNNIDDDTIDRVAKKIVDWLKVET